MDLQEPETKMSTTGGTPMGTVLVADPPDVIRRKFKVAVTDSGRDVRRAADKPGVSNLVDIMSVAEGVSPEEIENRYDGQGYGQFKSDVAEAVIAFLEPVRLRYEELAADPGELERLLRHGAEQAAAAAAPTLDSMYERMGFVRA
jgi:tryptophanyl-tRNA synthetase